MVAGVSVGTIAPGPVQAIVFISALLSANPPDTYACAGLTPTVHSSDGKPA